MTGSDPMAPRTGATPSLCGPLECVTVVTNDADATTGFMMQAMRLRPLAVDVDPSSADAQRSRELWGLPPDARWRELRFVGPEGERGAVVRVLMMAGGELIRPRIVLSKALLAAVGALGALASPEQSGSAATDSPLRDGRSARVLG